MRRRLVELQGNGSTTDHKQQPREEQPGLFKQMQKKLNNRMVTIHEKLESMVIDQLEKQIDDIATGLWSTDNITTNAKQYEKACEGDPSNYHHHNNNHENPKDETVSNSYATNLEMKDHIMDENIHLQVRHSQQSKTKNGNKIKKSNIYQPTYPITTWISYVNRNDINM
ncbi:unnamed protein product [Mytilus edulis]|uniref:Uncharacterized protein n=1 Tax=Mytilus edulis TaxID=6550 RepID=A0A8S3QA94_MYTED|nr:unnamed protein product [Mytilus edulis]